MFVNAIEEASKYTCPIHSIIRKYGSTEIETGCSTFIMINKEGYAITCRHVVQDLLVAAKELNAKYDSFCKERDAIADNSKKRKRISELEKRYGYIKANPIPIQIKSAFLNAVDKFEGIRWHMHPTYDLAIIKFEKFNNLLCHNFPILAKDGNVKPGKSLCRLGYPYPEFSNYRYNAEIDNIEWTNENRSDTPRFPIDGIVTRLAADNQRITEIEMSTPGLKGQSGGPLFDTNGILYGMQSATISLHLGFDQVDREINICGKKKKINDYSFIHLGRCVHINIIKEFLDQHGVKYNLEP